MPDKAIGSPADAGLRVTPPAAQDAASRPRATLRPDDGITNPRDGRGPLRPRDDQSAKLPLRPPH
jgi:hypothetical protein